MPLGIFKYSHPLPAMVQYLWYLKADLRSLTAVHDRFSSDGKFVCRK